MAPANIEPSLQLAEKAVEAVAYALLEGQAELLEAGARDLQQAAVVLAGILPAVQQQAALDPAISQRLKKVVRAITMQREACLRRSSVVERSLHSILPNARPSTYAGAATPYSTKARQSGAFKLLAA